MTDADKQASFARAERNCGDEYFETSTKPRRVADAIAAVRALSHQPWVREILLAGHSEGTQVVTGILKELRDVKITTAGLFASMGPVRYFCGYAARGLGDYELFNRTVDRMRMLQRADDDFISEGLPARRWKTFWLASTPIEDVRDSPVPLFVSQGTRDDTTLCSDLFVMEAIRQQPDRPVRYVVVDHGNHVFETPDGRWRVSELFMEFLAWSLNGNRQTQVSVLR
jgi:dipeptidyl aminopeptidase/acylaminoacyl peptidase